MNIPKPQRRRRTHIKYAFLECTHLFYPRRNRTMKIKGADYSIQIQSKPRERVKSPRSISLSCLRSKKKSFDLRPDFCESVAPAISKGTPASCLAVTNSPRNPPKGESLARQGLLSSRSGLLPPAQSPEWLRGPGAVTDRTAYSPATAGGSPAKASGEALAGCWGSLVSEHGPSRRNLEASTKTREGEEEEGADSVPGCCSSLGPIVIAGQTSVSPLQQSCYSSLGGGSVAGKKKRGYRTNQSICRWKRWSQH